MHISDGFMIECNIQIVIPMLYHNFETLLLLSFSDLMAKSGNIKKTDSSILVRLGEHTISYYGIIEIIWNKILDFLKLFSWKKEPIMQF